jgi:hypothetical protein
VAILHCGGGILVVIQSEVMGYARGNFAFWWWYSGFHNMVALWGLSISFKSLCTWSRHGISMREQKAKYLFFGLKASSPTKIYCFSIAFRPTVRNLTRRRAAGRRPAVVFDCGLVAEKQ